MNLILLGAPGAGKGTQASMICDRYHIVHISTGDIFRANIQEGTEIGLLAKGFLDRGELVPDEVTCAIVEDRLRRKDCEGGYLLDGFPRNLMQAETLDGFAEIDAVLNIDIDHQLLMARLCGRRVCSKCGESYHISMLDGRTTCSRCGGELYRRKDDNPETVQARLAVYNEQTAPLIEYYAKKGKLLNFTSTEAPPKELFEEMSKTLDRMSR